MNALKLTMFTPTRVTTASHYTAIKVEVAANAIEPTQNDCITLTAELRARHGQRHKRARNLSNLANVPPATNWRIPFPTNDNMAPFSDY